MINIYNWFTIISQKILMLCDIIQSIDVVTHCRIAQISCVWIKIIIWLLYEFFLMKSHLKEMRGLKLIVSS